MAQIRLSLTSNSQLLLYRNKCWGVVIWIEPDMFPNDENRNTNYHLDKTTVGLGAIESDKKSEESGTFNHIQIR